MALRNLELHARNDDDDDVLAKQSNKYTDLNNNNNNNNSKTMFWYYYHARAIARVVPVHLMNVERRQVAANPRPSQMT